MTKSSTVLDEVVMNKIHLIRGQKVMRTGLGGIVWSASYPIEEQVSATWKGSGKLHAPTTQMEVQTMYRK